MSRRDQIEREIANETTLGLLLAPFCPAEEVDSRALTVNGTHVCEREMSDGTFRVYVSGMRTSWTYEACIKWAGGSR